MEKKKPERQCIGCGEKKPKQELIRVVRTPEGQFVLDETGRCNGRGAYICKDTGCLAKARKKKALSRSFSQEVSEEVWNLLEEEMQKLV